MLRSERERHSESRRYRGVTGEPNNQSVPGETITLKEGPLHFVVNWFSYHYELLIYLHPESAGGER